MAKTVADFKYDRVNVVLEFDEAGVLKGGNVTARAVLKEWDRGDANVNFQINPSSDILKSGVMAKIRAKLDEKLALQLQPASTPPPSGEDITPTA